MSKNIHDDDSGELSDGLDEFEASADERNFNKKKVPTFKKICFV